MGLGQVRPLAGPCNTLFVATKGRIGWQRATGSGRRNHAETAIGRRKHLIGPKLRARTLPCQKGEAAVAVTALNRMIPIAKPISVRRARCNSAGRVLRLLSGPCSNALGNEINVAFDLGVAAGEGAGHGQAGDVGGAQLRLMRRKAAIIRSRSVVRSCRAANTSSTCSCLFNHPHPSLRSSQK